MLLRLFETRQPLLEINYDKTKERFLKKFVARVTRGLYPDSETGSVRVDKDAEGDTTFWDEIPNNRSEGWGLSWNHAEGKLRFTEADAQHWFKYAYNRCLKLDPTTERENNPSVYTEWMLSRYISGGIKLWEDMESIGELLGEYDTLKRRQVFKTMAQQGLISKEDLPKLNDINLIKARNILFNTVTLGRDFLKKNEIESAKDQYAKYIEWADKGGIEILWPVAASRPLKGAILKDTDDINAMAKEEFENFKNVGMVLRLRTVDASVALFQGPTAWCTARPGNSYFDDYKNGDGRGDTPARQLVVIVDNVNKKLYQFHQQTGQYLDEADAQIVAPLTIPMRMLNVAAKVYGWTARQLFKAMGGDDRGRMYTFAENIGFDNPNLGSELWEGYKSNPVSFELSELDQISRLYTQETGRGLPAKDVQAIASTLFGPPDGHMTGREGDWITAVLAGTHIRPDRALLAVLADRATSYPSVVFNYYQGTPTWKAMRDRMVREWMTNARGPSGLCVAASWMTAAQRNITVNPGVIRHEVMKKVYAALALTEEEISGIIKAFCESKKVTDSESDTDTDLIKNLLTYCVNVPREAITYYIANRPEWARLSLWMYILEKKLIHLVDLVDVREIMLERKALAGNDHWIISRWLELIAEVPALHAQLTPELLEQVFTGPHAFRLYEQMVHRSAFKELLTPPVLVAIKYGMLASLRLLDTQNVDSDVFLHPLYESPHLTSTLTTSDDKIVFMYIMMHPNFNYTRFRYCLQVMAKSVMFNANAERNKQLGMLILSAAMKRYEKDSLPANDFVDIIGTTVVNMAVLGLPPPEFWETLFLKEEWNILGGMWVRYKQYVPADIAARIQAKSQLFR